MNGKFFHRFIRCIGKRHTVAFEHILRIGNLAAASIDFGIILGMSIYIIKLKYFVDIDKIRDIIYNILTSSY